MPLICTAILLLGFYVQDSLSSCNFPAFLQIHTSDNIAHWISKTQYKENTEVWTSQEEITVSGREIAVKLKFHGHCYEGGRRKACYKKEHLYRRVCMKAVGDGKFRVQHLDSGKGPMYTCMQFIQRNDNVVQVKTASPLQQDEDRLCDDSVLQRQEWPWIAPRQKQWSPCPVVGGFDFRTFIGERRQKMCQKQWRPSRLESECVMGEGLRFEFPQRSCSPFQYQTYKELHCWASWKESGFIFVIAGELSKSPQYVLRLPADPKLTKKKQNIFDARREFIGYLYFSVITPISSRGAPYTKVMHVQLKMKRSQAGMCYDESDKCNQHALEGKCTNSALHEYANFCKRSCGLCNLVATNRAECRFSKHFRGKWTLFQSDRVEDVNVGSGEIVFSHLGRFICKSVHWGSNNYKLLSVFTNGCRPRYTCMQLYKEDDSDDVIRFQIAKSTSTDESFKMCNFEDDPPPIGDKVRSKEPKILLARSLIKYNQCGLGGAIQVNMERRTRRMGPRSCTGILSDWDHLACSVKPTLTFAPTSCSDGTGGETQEFKCIAYVNLDAGSSRLITRDSDGRYTCWVIQTYPERMSLKPWRSAYRLQQAQCGMETDNDAVIKHNAPMQIDASSDRAEKQCLESDNSHYFGSQRPPTYRSATMTTKPMWTGQGQIKYGGISMGTGNVAKCSLRQGLHLYIMFFWAFILVSRFSF